jgi:hypothetical protein
MWENEARGKQEIGACITELICDPSISVVVVEPGEGCDAGDRVEKACFEISAGSLSVRQVDVPRESERSVCLVEVVEGRAAVFNRLFVCSIRLNAFQKSADSLV